jgi:hypothetical protein
MTDLLSRPCAAFAGMRLIASGPLLEVALAAKRADEGKRGPVVVFDATSGAVIDLDLRGDRAQIERRLAARAKQEAGDGRLPLSAPEKLKQGPGRPRLGVVPREVTLLPRHWEWLAAQPGGASAALRRLVDQARKSDGGETEARARREAAYRFMMAMAGDLPGFEEAARALFGGDREQFLQHMAQWPEDVWRFAERLAFGPAGN